MLWWEVSGMQEDIDWSAAPSLRICLCAGAAIPRLGALLAAGARGGRSLVVRPRVQERMWQQLPAGTTAAKIPATRAPARAGCQACGNAALPPRSQGFQEKPAATGNVCLQACLPVRKCCDLLMETGGMRRGGRERSGKINSSQKNIEFKCC